MRVLLLSRISNTDYTDASTLPAKSRWIILYARWMVNKIRKLFSTPCIFELPTLINIAAAITLLSSSYDERKYTSEIPAKLMRI